MLTLVMLLVAYIAYTALGCVVLAVYDVRLDLLRWYQSGNATCKALFWAAWPYWVWKYRWGAEE